MARNTSPRYPRSQSGCTFLQHETQISMALRGFPLDLMIMATTTATSNIPELASWGKGKKNNAKFYLKDYHYNNRLYFHTLFVASIKTLILSCMMERVGRSAVGMGNLRTSLGNRVSWFIFLYILVLWSPILILILHLLIDFKTFRLWFKIPWNLSLLWLSFLWKR